MILPGKKHYRIALFVTALLIQCVLWIVAGPEGKPDGDYDYVRVGIDFLNGSFHNTFKPPLYSIFLLPTLMTGGPGILMFLMQMLLFALSIILTDRLCQKLGFSTRVALIAVAIEMLYPYYGASFLKVSDVLLNLVFIKWLIIAYPDKVSDLKAYVKFGLVVGFYAYLRPNVYGILPAFVLIELLVRRSGFKNVIKPYLAMAGGIFVVIIPWLIWTTAINGKPSLTTTNSGYNLLIGHNEYVDEFIGTRKFPTPEYVVWQHPDLFCRHWGKVSECEEENRKKAIEYIKENPEKEFKLIAMKFARYWDYRLPAENPLAKQLAYSVPYLFILVFAILGVIIGFRNKVPGMKLLVGIQFFHMLPFLVYFSTVRMRIHLDFILMIFVGVFIDALIRRIQIRQDA